MSRKRRVVIFGAGNRVLNHILPVLDRELCDVTIVRRNLREIVNTSTLLYSEFDFASSVPDITIVSTPNFAKREILASIKDAGWSCPVLVDTPTIGLEEFSSSSNFYALEESFFISRPEELPLISCFEGSAMFIFGALPRGHGLPALSVLQGSGLVPDMARVFLSLIGYFRFQKTRVFWWLPKTQRRAVLAISRRGIGIAFKSVVARHSILNTYEFKAPKNSSIPARWILDFPELKSDALRYSLLKSLNEQVPFPTISEGIAWENLVDSKGLTKVIMNLIRKMRSRSSRSNAEKAGK